MSETGYRSWWVRRGDGTRLQLGEISLLLGRAPDCHIGVLDPRVSARHALLSLTHEGPELIVFGRNPVLIDGQVAQRVQTLHEGAHILVASEELVIESSGEGPTAPPTWVFQRSPSLVHTPRRKSFTVGGGPEDVLQVPEWPGSAVRCDIVQGSLLITPSVSMLLAGTVITRGELVSVNNGDRLEYRRSGFTLYRQISHSSMTTAVESAPEVAQRVKFSYLPSGGVLELEFSDHQARLHLSELRCNLVAALVGMHKGYAAGEPISDEALVSLLWPNNFDRTNLHLNQVVHRLRCTLLKAGIDPYRVVERPKGAGFTRMRVDSRTQVELE